MRHQNMVCESRNVCLRREPTRGFRNGELAQVASDRCQAEIQEKGTNDKDGQKGM